MEVQGKPPTRSQQQVMQQQQVPQQRQQPQQQPSAWAPTSQFQSSQLSATCIYCSEGHLLDSCPRFCQLSLIEKKDFVFKQRLCFKCFGRGHRIGQCPEQVKCLICSHSGHYTLLHSSPITPNQFSTQTSGSSSGANSSTPQVSKSGSRIVYSTVWITGY